MYSTPGSHIASSVQTTGGGMAEVRFLVLIQLFGERGLVVVLIGESVSASTYSKVCTVYS